MAKTPPLPLSQWAYFLDVDGTLIEIAEHPDAIQIDRPLLTLVERLFITCGGAVALVSGRTLGDIERRLEGLAIPAAGQHGLVRRDAAGVLHGGDAAAPDALQCIRGRLAFLIDRHPNLLLEDKWQSLALHYRQAPQLASYLHRLLHAIVAEEAGSGLAVQKGKFVLEVKPACADKGTAIAAFLAEAPYHGRRPVFVGDDMTDEHGFAVVNRMQGISIKVGRGPSCARYRLRDVSALRAWLNLATRVPP
jgi:trehalose 6-phosphate phosphatase